MMGLLLRQYLPETTRNRMPVVSLATSIYTAELRAIILALHVYHSKQK